jgi:hypothetical protein
VDNTHINNQGPEMNVYQKLNAARDMFHKQSLKKSGHNKFAGYQYFELGDFVVPALSIFSTVGLTSVISFGDEIASMTIVNNDDPKEMICINSPMSKAALKGCHEVQNLGAVQTYLRRYLWVAALEIVEHDALDASEPIKPTKSGPMHRPAQDAEADALPQSEKDALDELAATLIDLVNDSRPENAKEHLHNQALEAPQKIYLWSKLPSNVRSAIKK